MLLIMSPGPNGVLIAKTVPTSGRNAGFANIAGFFASFYVHGAFSILGVSVILMQSATAFMIVKYAGAAYLLWLGIKALKTAFRSEGVAEAVTPAKRKRTLLKSFLEGFLSNFLNPKVALFYLAAFPQFITIGQDSAGLFFLLVTIHAVLNAIWFTGMVLLFSYFSRGAPSKVFKRWLNGVTGFVFIAFGLKLATFKA
jgi:threonine/homoserine/homoserine lactone efflux protein